MDTNYYSEDEEIYGYINAATPIWFMTGKWDIVFTSRRLIFLRLSGAVVTGALAGLIGTIGLTAGHYYQKQKAEEKRNILVQQGESLDEIIASDRNNFAVPNNNIDDIYVRRSIGDAYILFKFKERVGPKRLKKVDFNFDSYQMEEIKKIIEGYLQQTREPLEEPYEAEVLPDETVGALEAIPVKQPEEKLFRCPNCHKTFKIYAGTRELQCPHCGIKGTIKG